VTWKPWLAQPWYLSRKGEPDAAALNDIDSLVITRPELPSSIAVELERMLYEAEERVMCCSFLLGGEEIRRALHRAVERLRGHVYVITAVDDKMLARSMEPGGNKDMLRREVKRFESLTRHGVYVRGADACHAKFCVVDDRVALVGSANFDPNGLGYRKPGRSGELGLRTEDPVRVDHLKRLFRHIWLHGCGFEVPPDPDHYSVRSRKQAKPPLEHPPRSRPVPVWTGFGATGILEEVRSVIDQARSHLALASYSFTGMLDQPDLLISPLLRARERGVEVELFVRNRAFDLPELRPLVEAGVQVRGDRVNHAKYVLADDGWGSLFSANFDGRHGLTSGVEAGCRLDQHELADLTRYHRSVWSSATSEALLISTKEELTRARVEILEGLPDGLSQSVKLKGVTQATRQAEELVRGACLITRERDNSYLLLGPASAVRLRSNGAGLEVEQLTEERWKQPTLAKYLAKPAGDRPDPAWLPLGWEVRA